MLIIGSHVGFKKNQLLDSVNEAILYGANTFMFYTGAPQNTLRSKLDNNLIKKAHELMKKNNIDINNVVCHAPYIVNPATNDEVKKEFAINFLKQEIKRCEDLGITKMVLHPGSAVNETREEGINNIIDTLNNILDSNTNVTILLETMAGKGNELGITTEELKSIIDNVIIKDRIGICLDTCHLNDSGYDMNIFDEYLLEFDKLIGIEKIGCIHINDSKNIISSHKDRHENIGIGTIGFNTLLNIIYNEKLKDIPKILETPYVGNYDGDKERLYPPYKYEIEMIKNKSFDNNLLENIRNEYR